MNDRTRAATFLWLALLVCPAIAAAQVPVDTWTIADGLPQSSVTISVGLVTGTCGSRWSGSMAPA